MSMTNQRTYRAGALGTKSGRWRRETRALHAAVPELKVATPLSVPIYQTSSFAFPDADALAEAMQEPDGDFVYSRRGNPTVRVLESTITDLEGGAAGLATASGMGAISAVLLSSLRSGDHVLAQRCLYGGTFSLLSDLADRFGIELSFFEGDDPEGLSRAARPNTRLVYLETIANPTTRVADLPALLAAARSRHLLSVVDNSFASPVLCRPLEFGADVVVHSTTKYLAGHSDVSGGVAVFSDRAQYERCWKNAVEIGATADPFAAWLTLRGIQTLSLRMARHCESAALIADRLAEHPAVRAVYWPGRADHPDHARARTVLSGYGGMLAFDVYGGRQAGADLLARLDLIGLALSLGGVESLAMHPASTSHRELDAAALQEAEIGVGIVRLSVGLEHPEDIWDDLEQALDGLPTAGRVTA